MHLMQRHVCVCVRARACVHACVCVCVCEYNIIKLVMNICMEKEFSLSNNTNIIFKNDSCQLLANDRALSTFYAV